MSNFTNRNNSEVRELSDDSSQTYISGTSSENINRPISSRTEKHDCSDDEETKAAHGQKQGLVLLLLGSKD